MVFVIEEVAVKDGHALDHWIGEVRGDADEVTVGNIHRVPPESVGNAIAVFGVRQEIDLMDVHGVQSLRCVDNSPMLNRSNFYAHHGTRIGRELFAGHLD